MTIGREKVFVSEIDDNYMIKCWAGNGDIAYAFHVREPTVDQEWNALPPMDCPQDVVDELRPIAKAWLGTTI